MDLLTRYTEFETRDLDETVAMNRANMRRYSLEPRSRAPYYVRMRSAQADLLTVSTVVNASPVLMRTELDPRASCLLWLRYAGHGECRTGSRLVVEGPGEILFTSPERPIVYTTSGEDQHLVVRIPADLLEREGRLCAAQPLGAPFEIAEPFAAESVVGRAMRALIFHLNRGNPVRRLARFLVNAMVTTTANNWQPLLAHAPSGNELRIVRHAEEYMEAHLVEDFTMVDAANDAGVSIRALEYAFRHRRGRTATAMRRTLRLDEAMRRFLHQTEPITIRATAEALGFSNLGRFLAEYEQQFHEPAVVTLRRGLKLVTKNANR